MALRDWLQGAKSSELEELRDKLAALPPAPAPPTPSRPEMDPEERRALGAELRQRYEAFVKRSGEVRTAIEAAEARRREAEDEASRLNASLGDPGPAYCSWRDPVLARLWDERPALADRLIEAVREEARGLRSDSVEIPADVSSLLFRTTPLGNCCRRVVGSVGGASPMPSRTASRWGGAAGPSSPWPRP